MPELIFDTNVLSNFALAGQLALLREIYPTSANCTGYVFSEVHRGVRLGHEGLMALAAALDGGWPEQLQFTALCERQLYELLAVSLGDGEASCLAIAASRGLVFACDDRLARREATRLGVSLTGTVGILIKAVRLNLIELKAANALLKRMIAHGFYAPVKRLTRELVFDL